jgi:hypothetical protein
MGNGENLHSKKMALMKFNVAMFCSFGEQLLTQHNIQNVAFIKNQKSLEDPNEPTKEGPLLFVLFEPPF